MSIPPHILAYRDELLALVERRPDHALPPFCRQRLYGLLEQADAGGRGCTSGHLAYRTAAAVLPRWVAAMPHDREPQEILDITRDYLTGDITKEECLRRWERAKQQFGVEALAESRSFKKLPRSALWASAAALYAFWEAHAPHPFLSYTISPDETDADFDPWSSDVAQLASQAVAGGVWQPASDPEARRRFWVWWLTRALGAAWRAASPKEGAA